MLLTIPPFAAGMVPDKKKLRDPPAGVIAKSYFFPAPAGYGCLSSLHTVRNAATTPAASKVKGGKAGKVNAVITTVIHLKN